MPSFEWRMMGFDRFDRFGARLAFFMRPS